MLLIATDSIERLGKHNVEFAFPRTFKEFLITGAELARARYATVRVCCRDRPFLANDPLSANEELVLDRCRALEVGRIAGIYAHAHDGSLQFRCLIVPLLRRASSRAGASVCIFISVRRRRATMSARIMPDWVASGRSLFLA